MKRLLFFLLLLAIPIYAETSGTINFTTGYNATTGLYGSVVHSCNATADCLGVGPAFFSCYLDYDGNAVSGSPGWCNATGISTCFHDGVVYATGTYICMPASNTTYRQCTSGVWGGVANCSSGACVGGTSACSAAAPGGGPSGGPGSLTNTTATLKYLMIFSSTPSDFTIVQGNYAQRNITVKNTGNFTLYNITASVSGIPWYTLTPSKVSSLSINAETSFRVNFTIPENAEVKTYQVIFTASNHNGSATASKTVNLLVAPSEKTAQDVILPDYRNYSSLLLELQNNLTRIEGTGTNTENVTGLLQSAQTKLKLADDAIQAKDYASAVAYLNDAKILLDAAAADMLELRPPPFTLDPVVLVIIIVVIGVAAFVVYLILPAKDERKGLGDYFGRLKKKRK